MRKILTLFLLLGSTICKAQDVSDIENINKIKLNRDYLYGEATMEQTSEAETLAFDFLMNNLKYWVAENKDNVNQEAISEENIKNITKSITVPRRSLHRVFTYFDLDAIRIKKHNTDDSSEQTDSLTSEPKRELTLGESFEEEIVALKNSSELFDFFTQEKYFNKCQYGELNATTMSQINISQAYLIIYSPGDGAINAVLSKNNSGRKNLATGNDDSNTNYKGCRAIWVIF